MTTLDARYRAALPEFPLFEIGVGEEGEAAAQQAERAVASARGRGFAGHGAPMRVVTPALLDVDEVEIDAAPVVDEAEAALEAAAALPEWTGCVGVFDLETTGIDTETARIVSAHVGVLDDCGVVVERKDWLLDPGVEIPDGASAVHGISTARARRYGRPAAEVIPEILSAIRTVHRRGLPLVVYNAPYDLTLLAREADRHGLEPLDGRGLVVDPLVLDKALDRYRKGKRTLEVTAAFYGVELTDAHDAGADAIAAGRLAQAMAARYPVELGVELERLHSMQVEWCREQAERFADYMRRTKDPEFTTSGLWPCR
ncbi:exonuclease domain-containing protein [Naasia sp. SYSU D00948]|uniref:exonuclease domain-containing protein n=1 Tax=Naasia sp. SYSU D00948 TaxID=2817379 RepID=UPI0027DC4A5D|nr:exonuclease domain-containing protein [Naasia sp. SYSU D00948]